MLFQMSLRFFIEDAARTIFARDLPIGELCFFQFFCVMYFLHSILPGGYSNLISL